MFFTITECSQLKKTKEILILLYNECDNNKHINIDIMLSTPSLLFVSPYMKQQCNQTNHNNNYINTFIPHTNLNTNITRNDVIYITNECVNQPSNNNESTHSVLCECPLHVLCTGGKRYYPHSGYYATNENNINNNSPLIECIFPWSCPGITPILYQPTLYNRNNKFLIDQSSNIIDNYATMEQFHIINGTKVNNCAKGYITDPTNLLVCSTCDTQNHYYLHMLYRRCLECGTTYEDQLRIQLIMFFTCILFLLFFLIIFYCNSSQLSSIIGTLLLIQQIITMAQLLFSFMIQHRLLKNNKYTMSKEEIIILQIISYLSIINLDITIVKPVTL